MVGCKVSFINILSLVATLVLHCQAQLIFEDDSKQDKVEAVSGRIVVQAGGASFPNRLYQEVMFAYQFENSSVLPSYTSMGSSKGKCRIKDYFNECKNPYTDAPNSGADDIHPYFVDFSGSDSALDDESYSLYPDIQMYPAAAGAVVPIFNLPIPKNETLVLTPLALAKVFRNAISEWNDPEILEQNSLLVQAALNNMADKLITVVVREDGSGTSEIWKKSLSQFDPIYLDQIGTSSSNDDYNATVVKQLGNEGVAAFVTLNVGSIGYSVLGEATSLNLKFASLNKSKNINEAPVSATAETVENAIFEKGLNFIEPAERFVADIDNALSKNAWPIVGYTYFVLRKDTLRPGASCENRYATVKFLEWFYLEPTVKTIAVNLGFSVLPEKVRGIVLSSLRIQILCNGEQVWIPPPDNTIKPAVHLPEFYKPIFTLFKFTYETIDSKTILAESVFTDDLSTVLSNINGGKGLGYVLGNEHLSGLTEELVSIPYASIGMGAIFNWCGASSLDSCTFKDDQDTGIKMDPKTLAEILDGNITRWNDTKLQILNPTVVLPTESIRVFGQNNDQLRNNFEAYLQAFKSDFDIDAAVAVLDKLNTTALVRSAVSSTPFSIAYTPILGNFGDELFNFVDIIRPVDGNAIKPNAVSLKACATDTFASNGRRKLTVDLRNSKNTNCYPIVESLNLVTRASYSSAECSLGQSSTRFAGFLYQNILFDNRINVEFPLESASIGAVASTSPAISNQIKEILFSIDCNGESILDPAENKNLIDETLLGIAYFILALHLLLSVFFSYQIYAHKNARVMGVASPTFLQQIVLGSCLGMMTIIPLSMEDKDADIDQDNLQDYLDKACQSIPFLYSIAFVIVYTAVWLKTWRLHKIFNNRKLQKRAIHNSKLHIAQAVALIIVFIINLIWVILDPLKYERIQVDELESYAHCTSEFWYAFMIPLSVLLIAALLYGIYLLYAIWLIPNEFNESKWISFSLVTAFQALIIALPVMFISGESPTVRFLIYLFVLFATLMVPTLFLLVPKIVQVKNIQSSFKDWNDNTYPHNDQKNHTGSNTGSTGLLSARREDNNKSSSQSNSKSNETKVKLSTHSKDIVSI